MPACCLCRTCTREALIFTEHLPRSPVLARVGEHEALDQLASIRCLSPFLSGLGLDVVCALSPLCLLWFGLGLLWEGWICFGDALNGLGLLWVRWVVPWVVWGGFRRGYEIEANSRQQCWKNQFLPFPVNRVCPEIQTS